MKRCLAIVCLLLLPAVLPGQLIAKKSKPAPVDASRATTPDNRIVPFQRVGSIRLGMGMDQVQATLGKPSGLIYADPMHNIGATWFYNNLNLAINFSSGAAPIVTGAGAHGWPHNYKTPIGRLVWKDIDPIKVNFQTAEGITIGSTAFDVRRVYANYGYQDENGFAMNYTSLGLRFLTTMDHVVYAIGISRPQ